MSFPNESKISTITAGKGVRKEVAITAPTELFLLFWVAEDDRAKRFFSESAQTRLHNIRNSKSFNQSKHKIHCPPLHKFSEIQTIINYWINYYGGVNKVKTREVAFFSHNGKADGPIIYADGVQPSFEVWTQINFNWANFSGKFNTRCTFFGCNSAHEPINFSKKISQQSNFYNVEIEGQQSESFPSYYPDSRETGLLREIEAYQKVTNNEKIRDMELQAYSDFGWNSRQTYMVASRGTLKGAKATVFSTSILPMRFYKNGILLYEKNQAFFNESYTRS